MSLSVFTLISCIAPISLSNRAIAQTATPSTQSATEEKDLKTKVTEVSTGVISALNDTEIGGDFDGATKKHKIDGVNINPILKKIESRKKKRTFLKSIGRGYKSLKSQYTTKDITINGNIASVDIEEYTEAEFSDPGEAKTGFVPKYVKQHRLIFEVTNKNKLKLTAHKLINDPEEPDPESIKNAIFAPPDAIPAIIDLPNSVSPTSSLPVELKSAKSLIQNYNIPKFRPLLLASSGTIGGITYQNSETYDRYGAAQYAAKYWKTFNPNYRDFERVFGFINKGDCTNYASQALFEGGRWGMVGAFNSREQDRNWWYNSDTQSYTWAAAVNLHKFLTAHPERAAGVGRSSELDVGDVVQVDFGKGEGLSHTMIVTKKRDSDGMIYLAGHTISHLEMPVYDLKAKYPDSKVYAWKLRDIYYY